MKSPETEREVTPSDYEAPRIEESADFETLALSCSRADYPCNPVTYESS